MSELEELKKILQWYEKMGVKNISLNQPGELNKLPKVLNKKKEKILLTEEKEKSSSLIEAARKIADNCNSVAELKTALSNFEGLSIIKTATNLVFADGHEEADVMAIGEAPGANEDEEGIPFCGMSGKLLDHILASIGLSRKKNLYITNSVFWRPPANRKPSIEESEVCLAFVEKHIALIKPKLLLLVGSTPAATLLNSTETISRLRNNFYKYSNKYLQNPIDAAVIFHPSYLLRQPLQKKMVWFDLLRIKKEYL